MCIRAPLKLESADNNIKCNMDLELPTSATTEREGQNSTMRRCWKLPTSALSMQTRFRGTICRLKEKKQAIKPGGWKTMPFILGNEVSDKLATIGLLLGMILYLTQEFHFDLVAAANILNIGTGTGYITPIIGGYLADSYIGRYWTLIISSFINLLGMCFMLLTAAISSLRPTSCAFTNTDQTFSQCPHASTGQLLFLYLAFTLFAIATGGIKPCAYPFGADQFIQDTLEGKKSFQSYSNWYFFFIYLSVVLSATIVAYIQQSVGWAVGFAIPTIIMAISIFVYVLGTPFYRYDIPTGSPLKELAKVCYAAFHKRKLTLPQDPTTLFDVDINASQKHIGEKYVHSDQFRFLDKAAIISDGDLAADGKVLRPWRVCSVHQVEQLKLVIRTLPIMIAAMLNVLAVSQQNSFALLQANTMDRRMFGSFRIPAASTTIFGMLAIMICLPLYDKLVLPYARRVTRTARGITFLQRIGIGNGMIIAAMVLSGIVESQRRRVARKSGLLNKPKEVVPMSVFWLVPQLSLMGIGDAFNGIGQTEFFYDQVPESMRSTAGAINSCISGVGVYISVIMLTAVQKLSARDGRAGFLDDNLNKAHLDKYYYIVAGMIGANLIYFLVVSSWYSYKNAIVNPSSNGRQISMEGGQEQNVTSEEIVQEEAAKRGLERVISSPISPAQVLRVANYSTV